MSDLGRVLVTGGAGAIGSNVTDELVMAGADEIIVLDNLRSRPPREPRLGTGQREREAGRGRHLRPRAASSELMSGIDIVFHLAAIRITQCAEEPRLAHEVLVDGTYDVFEAAARGRRPQRVIASSSASVYGLAEEFPTNESHHPYANDTLYGAAKVYNEGLLRSMHAHATGSTTSRCATSTSTARVWTYTASTPRCWSAGWSASPPASRR